MVTGTARGAYRLALAVVVRLVASPGSGFQFRYWGVFGVGERVDLQKISATGAALDLTLDRPLQVVAAFGP